MRGQNHPLSQVRLEIRVSAGVPVLAGATLCDENGKTRGVEWVAHPGAPALPGLEVSRQAAGDHRLAVDLAAMPEAVHRVNVLLALPAGAGGPARFGGLPAPSLAVTGLDGLGIVGYALTGLDAESAVIALELYRRQGAWKVRAVGQGYAGGLAALFTDQGLPQAAELAGTIQEAVARGLERSIPLPAPRAGDADRSRRTALSTPGTDQAGPAPRGAPDPVPPHRVSPHGAQDPYSGQVPGGPGQSGMPGGPERPSYPGEAEATNAPAFAQPFDSSVSVQSDAIAPQPPASVGGPIDYTHPNRRHATPPPPQAPPAAPGEPAPPVAGDAVGWSMEERLYNQVWGMFEDLARTTAAYRSAVDFAESRMEKELDQVLSDPRNRLGSAGDGAREAAGAKRDQLVEQARAVLDRDLAQLTAESEVVEPALPPAYARWDNPVSGRAR